jgi:hypothetical protein
VIQRTQRLSTKLVGITRIVDQHVDGHATQPITQRRDADAVNDIERFETDVRMASGQFAQVRRLRRLARRGDDRPAGSGVLTGELKTDTATRTRDEHRARRGVARGCLSGA